VQASNALQTTSAVLLDCLHNQLTPPQPLGNSQVLLFFSFNTSVFHEITVSSQHTYASIETAADLNVKSAYN